MHTYLERKQEAQEAHGVFKKNENDEFEIDPRFKKTNKKTQVQLISWF